MLKKTAEDKDKIQKMSTQKENVIKEKIRYIDNINKVVNEKNTEIEMQKSELTILNKNILVFKKEIEEKKQTLAKELRNKEKIDAALKAQLEVNNKKDQQFLEMNESYKRAMNS